MLEVSDSKKATNDKDNSGIPSQSQMPLSTFYLSPALSIPALGSLMLGIQAQVSREEVVGGWKRGRGYWRGSLWLPIG